MAVNPTDSQVGQVRPGSAGMPPPSSRRRAANSTKQLSEDSQLGKCLGHNDPPPERGEKDKESSAVSGRASGALPAGFFQTAPPAKRARKDSNGNEFDAFMQEISAMGAVKNNKDGTVMEVEEDEHRRRREGRDEGGDERGGEPGGHDGGQGGGERGEDHGADSAQVSQEEDYADDFEQFVRRERMKEVRHAVQNKTRPHDQESHQEVMAQISVVGSNNAVRLPEVSLAGRQSIADSYNLAMQAASNSNSSESSEEDWRAKKL